MRMKSERLKREHADKYRAKRLVHHKYTGAARLWARGLGWDAALQIVSEAFDEALHEAEGSA